MFATDVVKYFFSGAGAPVGHVIKPLADSLFRIRTRGDVTLTAGSTFVADLL